MTWRRNPYLCIKTQTLLHVPRIHAEVWQQFWHLLGISYVPRRCTSSVTGYFFYQICHMLLGGQRHGMDLWSPHQSHLCALSSILTPCSKTFYGKTAWSKTLRDIKSITTANPSTTLGCHFVYWASSKFFASSPVIFYPWIGTWWHKKPSWQY